MATHPELMSCYQDFVSRVWADAITDPVILELVRIRVAQMLSIGVAGVIDETPLSYEGNKLVLSIPRAYAGLDGERLRRRFEALAELLDCQPELRFLH